MPQSSVNRFGELMGAIRQSLDRERMTGIARDAVLEQQEEAEHQLFIFSPQATPETRVTTGHDHTPIWMGWESLLPEQLPDGAKATVISTSEHVGVQRTGTIKKGYKIWPGTTGGGTIFYPGGGRRRARYGTGRLRFWLGKPLKWPVRVARLRKPGFVAMTVVEHPGFGPWGGRDFVETAVEAAMPKMVEAFLDASIEVTEPIREFFSER
jgi:hypothetical protein